MRLTRRVMYLRLRVRADMSPHTVTRLVPSHETITPETLRHPEVSVHEDGGMSSVRTPDSASRAGPGGADGS